MTRSRPPGRASTHATLLAVLGIALPGCAASAGPAAKAPGGGPAASAPSSPVAAAPAPAPARPTAADTARTMELLENAGRARQADDLGDVAAALVEWRRLRARAPQDGDLELVIALDEARTGQLDSAAGRLAGPVLSAAAEDTLPVSRYRVARLRPANVYIDGAFTGWHWYVWRARSEVAAARGRWEEATLAARRCVAARPMSGVERLLLAVCAGRAGHADEARAAAREAVMRNPGLPEALYLDALWAWKNGRRAEAQAGFRAAVAADSTFRPAVAALLRSRLPGTPPDSLPATVLTGVRASAMLVSNALPKPEDEVPLDQAPILAGRAHPAVPDTIRARIGDKHVPLWLYVDETGRVPIVEPGWIAPGFPASPVADLVALIPGTWRFLPGNVQGVPRAVWIDFNYAFPY